MAEDAMRDKLRDDIEGLLRGYAVSKDKMAMPAIEDWCLVVTFNDLGDLDNGKWTYLRGANQSVHRTIGLLTIASDDLRGVCVEDDD
jgi:hypothetical protein